jgi:outer membrane murein-binding lipoprotein Lpp
MRRFFLAAFVPVVLAGCLNPLYSRVDRLSDQMSEMSAKLDETNKQLAALEKRLDAANTSMNSFGGLFGAPSPKK